ncbi:hypothetical protein [Vulcanisaeta souniana]|uniref:Uncharacterized protein n=1 Tax=Vulcanisaeta souniana JCM 11219 TaxID=1293586 RepID=A0A830EDY1_9CREN|nr:hypothetical protein [Vulcanisaeta souniana]BDR92136.1 hypothetical protein Vsou_12290 [Vulcanisaeta souniana JCM 11219]GGI67666.1 hypothetical protein GCM10007112_00790 [Vulcanisaeta souniana JCM 11219]
MVGFEDLKISLSTYIMRSKRVSHQDLLKWASANKIGNVLLYLLIRELIREKKLKSSGEYVVGTMRIGGNDIKLSIPTYIEVPGEPAKAVAPVKRQTRQRTSRSSSILEVIKEERQTETRESSEIRESAPEQPSKAETPQRQEPTKVEEHGEATTEEGSTKPNETGGVSSPAINIERPENYDFSFTSTDSLVAALRRVIGEELPQNREDALKVAMAMLTYLYRYWSVGELRLKIDIAKQFGGINESTLRIEDSVLRALRKMGLVEVVEPGVVNRIKELPKDFVKVRLDSLFT